MNESSTVSASSQRTKWFDEARFGMFLHWGLYSLLGRGEWVMNRERIPMDEYEKLADEFTVPQYDPAAWAEQAVKAGMKYMVLTTKHHEGFCLWDSKACSFNSVNSAAKRDLVGEFVEAVRAAGLKVGLYYSLGDWREIDWTLGWRDGDVAARERFMGYTHEIVRELMTQYSPDILWYDLPQNYGPQEWRAVDLNSMARNINPNVLINNRAMTTEDFATAEQHISSSGSGRMWEACMTLTESWGYTAADKDYKSAKDVLVMLANVAGGAGNLLLNVGPDGQGALPQRDCETLTKVGRWLETHGESIYGTQRYKLGFNMWGPTTQRDNYMYLHLQKYFGEKVTVGGLTNRVLGAKLLTTGQDLNFEQKGPQTFLTGLPAESPDEIMSVVRLELDGPLDQDIDRIIGDAAIFPDFPK